MKTGPELSQRQILRQELRTGLIPCIWQEANLLHLSLPELLEELRRAAAELPIEVRAPRTAPPYDEEQGIGGAPSFEEAVGHQISLCPELDDALPGGAAWCELLDARGFLNCSPREAAAALGVGEGIFARALSAIQAWVEPPGLFALDLADSLRIQLGRLGMGESDAAFLLARGRAMLEEGRAHAFAEASGWSAERLEAALNVLRSLDPNPGGAFSANRTIVPELEFVVRDGVVHCRVMRENLPALEVLEGAAGEAGEAGETLARRARSLLLRLEGRERTLARVGAFFAERQSAYLSKRADCPAPLGLKDVARAVGLHVSTVSRILSSCWARSNALGVLRLSSLLLRRLGGAGGASGIDYAYLARTIRGAQEELLSDAEVADFLGIPRRTVAYHRQRLGLPPITKTRKRVTPSQNRCENRTDPASA